MVTNVNNDELLSRTRLCHAGMMNIQPKGIVKIGHEELGGPLLQSLSLRPSTPWLEV
jgi:hypothetical protein